MVVREDRGISRKMMIDDYLPVLHLSIRINMKLYFSMIVLYFIIMKNSLVK